MTRAEFLGKVGPMVSTKDFLRLLPHLDTLIASERSEAGRHALELAAKQADGCECHARGCDHDEIARDIRALASPSTTGPGYPCGHAKLHQYGSVDGRCDYVHLDGHRCGAALAPRKP